jgi:GNAT superfamily N-acetyltransferase
MIRISTDPSDVDLDFVHAFLTTSYWSPGISRDDVARGISHSLPFVLLKGNVQIGFARVVTDTVRFSWLCDVFVAEAHQGQGLAKMLLRAVFDDPRFARVQRWMLGTRDAHTLYEQFGFSDMHDPKRFMIKHCFSAKCV